MSEKTPLAPTAAATTLPLPAFNALKGKRVILASGSPRRLELLAGVGLVPEVVKSTYQEDLPKSDYVDEKIYEYPVETAREKGIEVYRRLVEEDPDHAPDVVIAADTIVIKDNEILEKPLDRNDALRMLMDLNDGACEVVTGIALVHPILLNPGYDVKSMAEKTKVNFAWNPPEHLLAYANSGDGMDKAGAFSVQGPGALFISSVEGDYSNVVGFPVHAFFRFLHDLLENDEIEL